MACSYLYEGKWYTEDQLRGIYESLGGSKTAPSKASPGTIKKIKEFLDRIGVETQTVAKITYNGHTLGINGLADPLNGLIQIVQGKEDVALPEEAMHMAVELIEQKDPKLFKEMMDKMGSYNLTNQVFAEYQNNPFYQTKEGKPDVRKIKKEAIGKVLAQTVIDKNKNAVESPSLLDLVRNWWDRIVNALKSLFLKAEFNPFEEAASQVLSGKLQGAVVSGERAFASRKPEAVNASMRLVQALRSPKVSAWYRNMYKGGNKQQFFDKLVNDLKASRDQVNMLEKWLNDKNIDSIGEVIAGVLSELSYTVEINNTTTGFDYGGVLDEEQVPTSHYSSLTVPGGVNYRENEIKTPDITPSIKGHAQFATDQGIGWFRSDNMVKEGTYTKISAKDFPGNEDNNDFSGEGTPTNTRRILEIQSDLFQKGREKEDLVYMTLDEELGSVPASASDKTEREKSNGFLQLLNKDNAWVTFFVKAIIQDSAKKGYENVRFPGGSTANKIEGQTTVEEFIDQKKRRVEHIRKEIESIEKPEDVELFKVEYSYPGDERSLEELKEDVIKSRQGEIAQLEREIVQAEGGEGLGKFAKIAAFYQETIQNILKKQGYEPKEVTDEYDNKWFEIKLKENRDLGEFYFQVSGQDLANRITDKHINITKRGDEFEINGNKIKNSIQKTIQDFYKRRIGAASADKALKGFKQETENKAQVDIQDILTRYIDDDNFLRVSPLPQTNPSAVNPGDNSFYLTLESHLQDRLSSYEPGTKFVHSMNLFDGINTAGKADLIAITPEGKVDILQFKVPQLGYAATDVPVYRQEAYNIEIEEIRKILQRGYNVSRTDFRQTRAIPIKAEYERVAPGVSDMKLSKFVVGNVNVALIQDDLLLPISSDSEATESEKFDKFIRRLKGLVQRISSERVPPDQRAERSQRVAQLVAAIRKLQIKKDGSGVVASAKTIIKKAKDKSKSLKEKIANTNPDVATVEELNKIAEDILSDKDQLEVYKDLYNIFKNTFTDGTVESEDMIKDARAISDDATDLVDDYWEMATSFRINKFAAKVGIKDEFTPEKKLTWYRRMIRSLSQSSIKAGQELWRLVERINNKFKLEYLDRLDELGKIEKSVKEWLKGKSVEDLYKKIFQYDSKGRWTGKMIQKIDRKFYEDLKKAQENRDMTWIKENIDIDEYMKKYTQRHAQLLEDSKTVRYSADDAENNRLIQQKLQDFVDTFHIDYKKGIGIYNWQLREFPKQEKWKSAEYQEVEANKPLLDLYEYYRKRLEESWDLGMLHEHNGWSWFPNVRRNLLEKLSTAPAQDKMKSFFGAIRIEAEDQTFGKIDPITGKPVDEVHANFVSDLYSWVEEAPGEYFKDYSEKSMDIFRVLALWDGEILKYRLRSESEGVARLLYYTEADPKRRAYESTTTGKLKREPGTNKPIEVSNEVNADYIKQHIDAIYYGKAKSNEFDVSVTIGEQKISGIKTIEAMNRYFVSKTLGLNVMTSIAQLFGGSINTFINQGLYFNKADMLDAEAKYTSGKFWASAEDKKLAGLVAFFHPYTEDRTGALIRKMSVSKMVEYLSSDHLFYLQRGSDNWVNTVVALSMLKNTMIQDGKLVNMRDVARRELGHASKYDGTYEQTKEFNKNLERRVKELQKSPQALINYARVENDQIVLDGIDRTGDTVIRLRQQMLEIIKDALGNTSHEDLSLYKRSVMWQSFFMFKNWIPRMADVRFGSLKYTPGTDKYEYGRMRMLANAVRHLGVSGTTSLLAKLGNSPEPLIEVAKKQYERKKAEFAEEQQDLDMTEAEFVDMYIKGVRSEVKELILAAALMSILIAMRINTPDKDDDPEMKGAYRWALRGLDKLTDELTFMYTPSSFTSILNGSVFPAVGVLVEFERFFVSIIKKLFWNVMGDQEQADKQKVMKHVFRALPVTKEIMTYLTIFNADMAKEYGIRLNTNYGSVR